MKPYTDYSEYLSRYFDVKVQKLTVNAGFICPNRDGTKGRGGCTYCNNASFSPAFSFSSDTVEAQLERGKKFFARKYPSMKYLAYFQSYTNTYGDVQKLMDMYRRALVVEDVVGLVIATRPDMMPDELLHQLAMLATGSYVMVEYGVETSHDITLAAVNRCHTWTDSVDAITRTHRAGLHVGAHLIMGLPGETRTMMLHTVEEILQLPIDVLKLHQLQVLRGTTLAAHVDEVATFGVEQYLELCCEIVKLVGHKVAIERFTSSAPDDMLLKPRWGLKNYQFVNMLINRLNDLESIR